MREIFNDYNYINLMLNNSTSNIYSYKYDKKIGLKVNGEINEDNKRVISEILSRKDEINLMIAPTGSGKTYEILNSDKQLILAIPTFMLTKQAGAIYSNMGIDCFSITAGANFSEIKEKMTDKSKLIVVYDLLESVLKEFDIKTVVIDEAHKLVADMNFRNCLKHIEDSFKGLNITYLTASAGNIMYIPFNNIYEFEQYKKDVFPISYRDVKYENSTEKAVSFIIDENYKNGAPTLIRLNSKRIIKKIINNKEKQGLDIGVISSDEKGIKFVNEDGTIEYDNEMTNCIINKSTLPKKDVYFATSICDEGVSITDIENGDIRKLEVIYAPYLKEDFNIDKIKQFEARIRTKYNRFSLLLKQPEELKEIKSLKEIFIINKSLIDLTIDTLNNNINNIRNIFNNDIEALNYIRESFFYTAINEKSNSDRLNNCLSIDDDFNISYDKKIFYSFTYRKFQNQFFNNPDELKSFISDTFEDDYYIDETKEVLEDVKLTRKEQQAILREMNELPQTNKEKKEFYSNFSLSFREEIETLSKFGFEDKEVLDLMSTKTIKYIEERKQEVLFNNLYQYISTGSETDKFNNETELIKFLQNKDTFNRINLYKTNLLFYQITKIKGFEDVLLGILNSGLDFNFILSKTDSVAGVIYLYKLNQYINNNKLYKKGLKLMGGLAGEEQEFIIKNIGKYENKDGVYLTNNKVDKLTKEMKKKFKQDYKVEDIEKVIRMIFKINTETNRFNGLRLKY